MNELTIDKIIHKIDVLKVKKLHTSNKSTQTNVTIDATKDIIISRINTILVFKYLVAYWLSCLIIFPIMAIIIQGFQVLNMSMQLLTCPAVRLECVETYVYELFFPQLL